MVLNMIYYLASTYPFCWEMSYFLASLQVEIKYIKVDSVVMYSLYENQFTIMVPWTGTKYDLIFGISISMLYGDILYNLFHCIQQVEIKYNQV